jgi:hypothetical protein
LKSRPCSVALSLAFAGLALSVFFWGLSYKLSLYDAHELSSHRIPRASLLSRNEDPKANETAHLTEGSALQDIPAITILSAALLLCWFEVASAFRHSKKLQSYEVLYPWCIRIIASLTAFAFRPPPTISLT